MNPCVIYKTLEGAEPTEALTEMLGRFRGARYTDLYLFPEQPVTGVAIDLTKLTIEELQARFDDPVKPTAAIWVTVAQADAIYKANKIQTGNTD